MEGASMTAVEPLPIPEPVQEDHPRDTGDGCRATMQSPTGVLVCDRELFHPGSHSQGGAIAWPRR